MGNFFHRPIARFPTPDEEERLTCHIETIYHCLKLDYESKEVKDHRDFIENIVDIISAEVNQGNTTFETYFKLPCALFKTSGKLPNGSFYQKTKIDLPDEFDFLIPFSLQSNRYRYRYRVELGVQNTKRVFVSSNCKDKIHASIKDILLHSLLDLLGDGDVDLNKELGPDDILERLHEAVSEALTLLNTRGRLVYRGQCDLKASRRELVKEGNVDPRTLRLNEVLLDTNRDGPCITLAVGGPFCVTYVDMTFCLEDDKESDPQNDREHFILPRSKSNWIPTEYAGAHKELNKNHTQVLMIFKYCLARCKEYQYRSTYNSHILKTLVLHHSKMCEKYQESCFYDVAGRIFSLAIEDDTAVNQHITITPKWLDSLCNYGYPGGDIIRKEDDLKPCDILFTLIIYTFVQSLRSSSEIVDLVRTREALSVCLQLICKRCMDVTNIHITSDSKLEYNGNISKASINDFICKLRDLRHKGTEVNDMLSSPPFPYPPYWPDPDNPLRITSTGAVEILSKSNEPDEWNKWRNIIKSNIEKEKRSERNNRLHKEIQLQEKIKLQEADKGLEEIRQEEKRQEKIKQEKIRQEKIRQEEIRQEKIRQEEIRLEEIRQEWMGLAMFIQRMTRQETTTLEMITKEIIRQEQIRLEEIRQVWMGPAVLIKMMIRHEMTGPEMISQEDIGRKDKIQKRAISLMIRSQRNTPILFKKGVDSTIIFPKYCNKTRAQPLNNCSKSKTLRSKNKHDGRNQRIRKSNSGMKSVFNQSDRRTNSASKMRFAVRRSDNKIQTRGQGKSGIGRRNEMKANIRRELREI